MREMTPDIDILFTDSQPTTDSLNIPFLAETLPDDIDDESTQMTTPSELIQHIFCPRFTYFMSVLKIDQHEELRYKVLKGRAIHQQRETTNRDYLRKRLGCIDKDLSVYLASRELRLRGIVDEVLHLSDGTLAPLDYKYTEYTDFTYNTHKTQSVMYALLIMQNYQKPVKRGFICYVKNGAKLKEIVYKDQDFVYTKNLINEYFEVVQKGYFPKKTKDTNKCIDCCYKNICA